MNYTLFMVSDSCPQRQTLCGNRTALERILTFGREIQSMSISLRREHGKNETNKKALQVIHVVTLDGATPVQICLCCVCILFNLTVSKPHS